jgi:hypothetical protein
MSDDWKHATTHVNVIPVEPGTWVACFPDEALGTFRTPVLAWHITTRVTSPYEPVVVIWPIVHMDDIVEMSTEAIVERADPL